MRRSTQVIATGAGWSILGGLILVSELLLYAYLDGEASEYRDVSDSQGSEGLPW